MDTWNVDRVGERGVSNVIGIILVVGITVVLASVVAVNVVGLGNSVKKPPDNVLLSTDYDNEHTGNGEVLTIEHRSGDELDAAKVSIDVDGATTTGGTPVELDTTFAAEVGSDDLFRSGETIVLDKTTFVTAGGGSISGFLDLSDADVRLIWKSSAAAKTTHTIYHCDVQHPDCENRD